MDVTVSASVRGPATVLTVSGELDMASVDTLRGQLATAVDGPCEFVVVDLQGVDFLDSSALGALVAAHRDLAASQRELRLAAPRPHVGKIFAITKLTDVIAVFDTVDAACA